MKGRWISLEFLVYYFILALAVYSAFTTSWKLSSIDRPYFNLYKHRLSTGWIGWVDNSDGQYANFRDHIVTLSMVVVGHCFISNMSHHTKNRMLVSLVLSLVYVFVLHGMHLIKLLFIITSCYLLVKSTHSNLLCVGIVWLVGICLLIMNHQFNGYPFESFGLDWLNVYQGLNPRWWLHFNFVLLRVISFTMDYRWSKQSKGIALEHKSRCVQCKRGIHCERMRSESSLEDGYNLMNYYAYCFYAPLYLAGPIISFNDFVHQMKAKPCIPTKQIIIYLIRWIVCYLLMEFMLHTIYVTAISKSKLWDHLTAMEISIIGYFNLKLVWLKLLIIWRFMRLWAMMDQIQVPENMHRCMSNNYSPTGFWRSWHRSYNRWLVRYMYIPLGGRKRYILNMLLVFTFVAIWHDVSLNLLYWGWLITLFILPEVILGKIFNRKPLNEHGLFRHLCGIGAVLNILMMMIANLVGFCVGLDGLESMLLKLKETGIELYFSIFITLFAATQIMFEVREEESRQKNNLRF